MDRLGSTAINAIACMESQPPQVDQLQAQDMTSGAMVHKPRRSFETFPVEFYAVTSEPVSGPPGLFAVHICMPES